MAYRVSRGGGSGTFYGWSVYSWRWSRGGSAKYSTGLSDERGAAPDAAVVLFICSAALLAVLAVAAQVGGGEVGPAPAEHV